MISGRNPVFSVNTGEISLLGTLFLVLIQDKYIPWNPVFSVNKKKYILGNSVFSVNTGELYSLEPCV